MLVPVRLALPVTVTSAGGSSCTPSYNNPSASQAFGPIVSGASYSSRICAATRSDWYRLSTSTAGQIVARLTPPPMSDYNLELLAADQSLVDIKGGDDRFFNNIFVDNGQLLDRVVDSDRLGGQPQALAQFWVCDRSDAGGPVPGEVNRDSVRLAVIKGGQDTLSGGHRRTSRRIALKCSPGHFMGRRN